jgi:hypothetical protein
MSFPKLSYLRLPRAALARRDAVGTLLRARVSLRGHARAAIWHAFAFKDDELLFARALLEARSCLWLYRTHQRAFAGDFVVVDVSSPDVARRPVAGIELKRGEALRLHDGAVIQLRNVPRVVEAIGTTGVVDGSRRAPLVTGSAAAVLRFLARGGLRSA